MEETINLLLIYTQREIDIGETGSVELIIVNRFLSLLL
jgi:hypothetical protein